MTLRHQVAIAPQSNEREKIAITKEPSLPLTSLLPRVSSEPGGISDFEWRFIYRLQGSRTVPLIDTCGLSLEIRWASISLDWGGFCPHAGSPSDAEYGRVSTGSQAR